MFLPSKNLEIFFVDVGQGDCCLIRTISNKIVLIDGGGTSSDYDVGKSVLLPYLLHRKISKIDYIIISHFDTDHVKGILTIMEELKVKSVVISRQNVDSDNYEKFKRIVKQKNIRVIDVNKKDKLKIEKDIYFEIIWPNDSNNIIKNPLNNNSIVCKLVYNNFSILFTGDIEEIAEKEILKEYKSNSKILNSTILKVAHHGSKTSTCKEFLERINPKIALIGVGKNNKFGHPNKEIIERLSNNKTKIYRTDEMGEIGILVDNKGKISIKGYLNN